MKLPEIKDLRYFHFAAALVVSLLISGFLLRQNNLKMVSLRDVVVAVDEKSEGDIDQIEPALIELSNFVNSHMNTTMNSPVVLVSRYNVLFTQQLNDEQKTASSYRQKVYAKAQSRCEIASVPLTVRANCIQDYVSAQPGVPALDPPPVEQFSYIFVSPVWSFDLAGLAVLLSALLAVSTVASWLLEVGFSSLANMIKNDPLE